MMTPNEYTSAFLVSCRPSSTSGAVYCLTRHFGKPLVPFIILTGTPEPLSLVINPRGSCKTALFLTLVWYQLMYVATEIADDAVTCAQGSQNLLLDGLQHVLRSSWFMLHTSCRKLKKVVAANVSGPHEYLCAGVGVLPRCKTA